MITANESKELGELVGKCNAVGLKRKEKERMQKLLDKAQRS